MEHFRRCGLALRFVTNTTAHSRDRTLEKLARLGLRVASGELVTPAALAVQRCRERGHRRVALIMNEAKWKSISPADQAAIEKLSGEALALRAGKAWDAVDTRAVQAVQDAKIPIVIASPQFIAEIKGKTAPLEQAWYDKVKAKGGDGQAMLSALRSEIATLSKK